MASRQKTNKTAEKSTSNVSNGVGKHPGKTERQTPAGTEANKSVGQEKVTDETGPDNSPMKQCVNVVEKKLRNLVKRKGKLDDYKKILKSGGTLNPDQKEAIDNYEILEQNLEFVKDLHKQFQAMNTEYEKQAKKQARRDAIERHRTECARVKEVMRLLHFLDCLGSDELRTSLCDSKSIDITSENLEQFDEFYKLLSVAEGEEKSTDDQLMTVSSHLVSYLDSQDKSVVGSTYKNLRELVGRASTYTISPPAAVTPDESETSNVHDDVTAELSNEQTSAGDSVADTGRVELEQAVVEQQEPSEPAAVEISGAALQLVDTTNLHSVINETASQSYPFGMKYQPSDVQEYCFLSNDEVTDPLQVSLVTQMTPSNVQPTPQALPTAVAPHSNPTGLPHQPTPTPNPHT